MSLLQESKRLNWGTFYLEGPPNYVAYGIYYNIIMNRIVRSDRIGPKFSKMVLDWIGSDRLWIGNIPMGMQGLEEGFIDGSAMGQKEEIKKL